MEEQRAASPTGEAKFKLPPWAVWALTTIAGTATGCYALMDLTKGEEKLAMVVAIAAAVALGLTPGLRKAALVLLCCLPMVGCQTAKPFIITGESLDTLGEQFVTTADAMNTGLDSGAVTEDQYRAWAAFATRFQKMYGPTVEAWVVAVAVNDELVAGQLGAAISKLAAELFVFYAQMKEAKLLPPGAP